LILLQLTETQSTEMIYIISERLYDLSTFKILWIHLFDTWFVQAL